MASVASDIRLDLEDGDLARALERRVLCVSADGLSWEDAPAATVTRAQCLELYYYMALTRAVDHEIVKLMRKGFAFGKHLMAVGNEAHWCWLRVIRPVS